MRRWRASLQPVRTLANQAFSRAAGAPLIEGNHVRLLEDARENYPAWLDAIAAAQHHVHFENYIVHEDEVGEQFASAFISKAKEGVPVRVIYDWMGAFGNASRGYWQRLREGGVEVRCYNPPSIDAPFGWLSRDHRKMLSVDGRVSFITGLCVGRMWVGIPEKNVAPWRDTGVEIRGPVVEEVESAFAVIWSSLGEGLPEENYRPADALSVPVGEMSVRLVATLPATAGIFRLDQMIAALASKRLWLTDAYYAGTTAYVQALRSAAVDGVDVRLLLPNATDLPFLRPLSRSGYRPLIEAGVRVFEWNGTMLHAKTAVADGRWARVGSTNLNIASWLGNCELDAVVEDEGFARQMEEMYERDLENATEIVLDARRRARSPGEPRHRLVRSPHQGGSIGRAAAGAIRLGNVVGAAFMNRRALEPIEARITLVSGVALMALGALFFFFPRVLAYPAALLATWVAITLLVKGVVLLRRRRRRLPPPTGVVKGSV